MIAKKKKGKGPRTKKQLMKYKAKMELIREQKTANRSTKIGNGVGDNT